MCACVCVAGAASDGLLLLALQALQQWVHAGIVLSDLLETPALARGLLRALRAPAAASLAAEVLVELVAAVEVLPSRPVAVGWLVAQLHAEVAPQLAPDPDPGPAADPAAAAAAVAPLLPRAPSLHALCRVAMALLRHEAACLAQPPQREAALGLLRRLLALSSCGAPDAAEARLGPLWEALLDPAGWAALEARSVGAGLEPGGTPLEPAARLPRIPTCGRSRSGPGMVRYASAWHKQPAQAARAGGAGAPKPPAKPPPAAICCANAWICGFWASAANCGFCASAARAFCVPTPPKSPAPAPDAAIDAPSCCAICTICGFRAAASIISRICGFARIADAI